MIRVVLLKGVSRFSLDVNSLATLTHPSYVLKSAENAIHSPGPTLNPRPSMVNDTSLSQCVSSLLNRFLLPGANVDFCTVRNEALGDHTTDSGSSALYALEKPGGCAYGDQND
jgi:hypothetical protein